MKFRASKTRRRYLQTGSCGAARTILRAFTLVEILVVIAIIALLLSILMPTLLKVRNQAKGVICQQNLHEWGLKFQLYAYDNEGSLPLTYGGGFGVPIHEHPAEWSSLFATYILEEPDLILCPMANKIHPNPSQVSKWMGTTFGAWHSEGPSGTIWMGSYGLNYWCSNTAVYMARYSDDHIGGCLEARDAWQVIYVKGAGNIPIFLDCLILMEQFPLSFDEPPEFSDYWDPRAPPCDSGNVMQTFCIDRHSGGPNGVFLDGSIRKIGLKELWTLKWHRSFDTCGPWTKCGGVHPADWPEWMRGYKDY